MNEAYNFPVEVEFDEDGICIVSYLAFKGCHVVGKTVDDELAGLRDVIEMCMEE
jgi:predicted RNase H-like HicB family nuclease